MNAVAPQRIPSENSKNHSSWPNQSRVTQRDSSNNSAIVGSMIASTSLGSATNSAGREMRATTGTIGLVRFRVVTGSRPPRISRTFSGGRPISSHASRFAVPIGSSPPDGWACGLDVGSGRHGCPRHRPHTRGRERHIPHRADPRPVAEPSEETMCPFDELIEIGWVRWRHTCTANRGTRSV